jgi:putative endonuclease
MFYTYVLKSEVDKKLYIGSTNNLRRRLAEHQDGKVLSTKPRKPFSLVYYEAYKAELDARHREESLKLRGRARVQLIKRLSASLQA